MGGTLHGCELGEFLVKRHRKVIIAHDGPASELGDEMGRDDLANLLALVQAEVRHAVAGREVPGGHRRTASRSSSPTSARTSSRARTSSTRRTGRPTRRSWSSSRRWSPRSRWPGSAREPGLMADAVRGGDTRRLRRLGHVDRRTAGGSTNGGQGCSSCWRERRPTAKTTPRTICAATGGAGLSFGDLLDRAADIHPNKEAFVDRWNRLTYAAGAGAGRAAGHRPDGPGHQAARPGDDPAAQLDRVRGGLLRLPEDRRHHGDAHRPLPAARGRSGWPRSPGRWPGCCRRSTARPTSSRSWTTCMAACPAIRNVITVRGEVDKPGFVSMERLIAENERTPENLARLAERAPDARQVAHMGPTGGHHRRAQDRARARTTPGLHRGVLLQGLGPALRGRQPDRGLHRPRPVLHQGLHGQRHHHGQAVHARLHRRPDHLRDHRAGEESPRSSGCPRWPSGCCSTRTWTSTT